MEDVSIESLPASVQHRLEWTRRLIEWVIPRLKEGEAETAVDMIQAALSESYNTGIDDCANIVERLRAERSTHEMKVIEDALRKLAALNRAPHS